MIEGHHKIMRKQITMNVFPFGNDGTDPALVIKAVIINFCFIKKEKTLKT